MNKEKWYRKYLDYAWITILMCALVFGPIILVQSCNAQEDAEWLAIPDRKAYWQGGYRGYMIDHFMAMGRVVRQKDPTAVPLVQVWADMETGIWNMWLTIGHRTEKDGVVNWNFRMRAVGRNDPTPYEYREGTGQECIMSYYLEQYEWFHGRQGDI